MTNDTDKINVKFSGRPLSLINSLVHIRMQFQGKIYISYNFICILVVYFIKYQ